MDRIVAFGLTGVALWCFVRQFFGDKKTAGHRLRGILVGVLSLIVVVINTVFVTLQRGLTWDASFLTHTGLGTAFFVGLAFTCVWGVRTHLGGSVLTRHRRAAYTTAVFFSSSLFAAVMVRLVR